MDNLKFEIIFPFSLDCKMLCDIGVLSADCSRCECKDTFQGQVFNSDSEPIFDVSIHHIASPTSVAATSSRNGRFTLENVCNGQVFRLKKDGYISLEFDVSQSERLEMQHIGTLSITRAKL